MYGQIQASFGLQIIFPESKKINSPGLNQNKSE